MTTRVKTNTRVKNIASSIHFSESFILPPPDTKNDNVEKSLVPVISVQDGIQK
ncbi:hypothetical protein [Desulforegula conservatrix]|uniref:hypothetical protein n=1 Tax=Desulforegula conservatrix TaxID=153026 RepID=UPI0012EC36D2|nr:hypothetical protein [Desulforegula conservatrix]